MDIYKEVTDRIVAEMEKGIIPWEKPWIASGNCVAHTTGKPYSLLNQMLLGRPGEYITFNQCQKEGGKVKKGEKSHMVVFWKWIEQEDEETGEKKEIPFLRYYNVFHIDQCEGISAKHTKTLHMPDGAEAIEEAQEIIYGYLERENVKLLHQEGDRAFYRPSTDEVVLPIRKQFMSTAEYYSTVFHELTHSTGHASRLNRLTQAAFFGSEDYSKRRSPSMTLAQPCMNCAAIWRNCRRHFIRQCFWMLQKVKRKHLFDFTTTTRLPYSRKQARKCQRNQ